MPRHPPCALSSLTTRIECSQTHLKPISRSRPTPEGKTGITLRVSPTQPQILAGKRADTTWGSNVFSLRHRLTCRSNSERHAIALGERRSIPVRRRDLTAFFQDANYHDQIVNERERGSDGRSHCRPVCGNRTRDKWDRPRQTQNLAADHSTVKRPEKSGQSNQFRPPKRGYNRFHDTHRRAERFGTGGGRDGLLGGPFRMVAAPCATGRSRRGGPCFHDENGLRPAFRGHRAASPNERCRQCR